MLSRTIAAENKSAASSLEGWLRSHADLVALAIVGAGFLIRLKAASGTFLNYDEALHFFVANQTSWRRAYEASPGLSHPPLLVFVLYAWRVFGTSEFMLRLPSVLLGTGFCWVSVRWMKNLFGVAAALAGLMFLAFSPSMISLSAEVRQYALLLFFAACALCSLEPALEKNSTGWMLAFVFSLSLAVLSHYSGILLAGSLGVYAILRMVARRPSAGVMVIWGAGQAALMGICAFLYSHYITKLGSTALQGWMGDTYLHNSYFDPQRHHALIFAITRTVSVFQYIFSQPVVGAVGFVLFVAGIVLLCRTERPPDGQGAQPYQLVILLLLPLAIDCIAALAGKYPYGGTRHCAFLALFAVAAIGFALAKLVKERVSVVLSIGVLMMAVCGLFPSHRLPYIARDDQSRVHMQHLIEFIQQRVPSFDLIFTDEQGGMLLGHYLCEQRPVSLDKSVPGFNSFECDGHRVVQARVKEFYFTAESFLPRWKEMAGAYGLKDGDTVWVVQAGWFWDAPLAQQLQKFPQFHDLKPQSFGRNLMIFPLPDRVLPVRIPSSGTPGE